MFGKGVRSTCNARYTSHVCGENSIAKYRTNEWRGMKMEQKTHRNVNDMFGNVRHRSLLATSPNGQKSLLQKKNAVCVRECLAAV